MLSMFFEAIDFRPKNGLFIWAKGILSDITPCVHFFLKKGMCLTINRNASTEI